MRLDKYLKVSRLVRRRPLAKKMADEGRIKVNDQVAKASTNLMVGDELEITFGQTILTIKVKKIKEHVPKKAAENLYEIIKEERVSIEE